MTFRNQLKRLNACPESIEWVKDKTIEEAWATCENSQWMLWVLTKTDLDLIDPICDMAERVLYLVPKDRQLACIWAISAARRRASQDELDAAAGTVFDASFNPIFSSSDTDNTTFSAATNAVYHCIRYVICTASDANDSCDAVIVAAWASTAASNAAYFAAVDYDYRDEQKKQCNILRKYFTITKVKKALNKLIA